MAPEQLEGRTADDRTDIFALGVVLYEMVTGRRAFEGSSEASLIGNILHTEPPAPSAVNPLNPAALDELIGKCLAKKPDARWQTAAEVRARLSGIHDLQSAADTPQDFRKRHVKPARPGPGDPPERADVASNSPSVEGVLQARGKHQPWFQQRSFLGAVALIGLSAGLTWLVTFRGCAGPGEPPRAVRFVIQPTPVESFTSLAVSPDGSSVVYGFGGLLLNRRIDQASGEPIVGSERAYEPFWSPDGRQLAFRRP